MEYQETTVSHATIDVILHDSLNCNHRSLQIDDLSSISGEQLLHRVSQLLGEAADDYHFAHNGYPLRLDSSVGDGDSVHCFQRICGGKGGFGSLLRSFGRKYSRSKNKDACRDLSGRRVRDVKAEKEVKEWLAKESTKEQKEAEKREAKVQKLKGTLASGGGKHVFKNPAYERERQAIPDKIHSAVAQGLQATSTEAAGESTKSAAGRSSEKTECADIADLEPLAESSETAPVAEKRKADQIDDVGNVKSKKMKGWLGVESGSDSDESD